MKSSEIREQFLKYFEANGHTRVRSSSLIPAADPTLLFTNAGMVQFKDAFLGLQDPGYKRATTAQKCVRAGGKHNDLENVGITARHHTFFEMLGNFSFGDYFKKNAIAFAWELITKKYKIPEDRLRVTVFEKDDEAFDLWKAVGVRPEFISRLGEKDNFWAMGDTGPCGPCTEIHYDWGTEHAFGKEDTQPGGDSTRFVEIWNLVFMQFNRDSSGTMHALPKPSVDTGAGLERIAAVLQGVYSNYDTDVFTTILESIAQVVEIPYRKNPETDVSMRVIADHIRSGTFLLSDGVIPSNEGRGYVLRRILRRAIRHGKKLGQNSPFMYRLVDTVVNQFGSIYPELRQNQKLLETQMREEEERFHETLHRGMGLLDETIQTLKKDHKALIPGAVAFKLYDTFGFPFDLIQVIGREHHLDVDEANFNELMEKQRSQSAWSRGDKAGLMENIEKALDGKRWETPFLGYEKKLETSATAKLLLSAEGKEVARLAAPSEGYLVSDKTPFYAESGGQIGDKGRITVGSASAKVESTFKIGKTIVHQIKMEAGELKANQEIHLQVDAKLRKFTAINHTATHMLHAALRTVLGERVKQAGSLVDPTKLRFDFTYPKPVTREELAKIEWIINEQVMSGAEVSKSEMSYDDAIKSGALAFFDEKYGDKVRVVRIGDSQHPYSVELCGGTHLDHTQEIGLFEITGESSVASGVRRIEAVTSLVALGHLKGRSQSLQLIEQQLGTTGDLLTQKVTHLQSQMKTLQKENDDLKLKVVQGGQGGGENSLWDRKVQIKDIQVVREVVPSVNPKILRTLIDQIRDKLKEKAIVMLACHAEGKVSMCVGLSKDLAGRWNASQIIQPLAAEVGGTGGGKPDFAQAGGSNPDGLPKALKLLEEWVRANA